MDRLGRSFYSRYTLDVARELLGCVLVRRVGRSVLSGRIVEAEAYRGTDDPASHSYRRATKRSAVMFGEAGHVYMFFSYGNHWCLNFTAEKPGEPGGILIRALEPMEGVEKMMRNRGVSELQRLANGPGNLAQALEIDGGFNGEDLVTSKRIYVVDKEGVVPVKASARIGISKAKELPWRFFVEGSPFVSKRNA